MRSLSEFGRLCPVSFSRGSYRRAGHRHRAAFMGKLYRFAGPDEMRSFVDRPRRFLDAPRPGLPVRAVFYGPAALCGPAAAAVRRLFGHRVVDARRLARAHREAGRRAHVSAVVGSVLETARRVTRTRDGAPGEVVAAAAAAARTAIGDWMRLCFGAGPDEQDDETGRETFEDDSGPDDGNNYSSHVMSSHVPT